MPDKDPKIITIDDKIKMLTDKAEATEKEIAIAKAEAKAQAKSIEDAKKSKQSLNPTEMDSFLKSKGFDDLKKSSEENSNFMDKFKKLFSKDEVKEATPYEIETKKQLKVMQDKIDSMERDKKMDSLMSDLQIPEEQQEVFSLLLNKKVEEAGKIDKDIVAGVLKAIGYTTEEEEPKLKTKKKSKKPVYDEDLDDDDVDDQDDDQDDEEEEEEEEEDSEALKKLKKAVYQKEEKLKKTRSGRKMKGGGRSNVSQDDIITSTEFKDMSITQKGKILKHNKKLFKTLEKKSWEDIGFKSY